MAHDDYRGCGISECQDGWLISTPKREGKPNREFVMHAESYADVCMVIDEELALGPDFIHMSEAKKLTALGLRA